MSYNESELQGSESYHVLPCLLLTIVESVAGLGISIFTVDNLLCGPRTPSLLHFWSHIHSCWLPRSVKVENTLKMSTVHLAHSVRAAWLFFLQQQPAYWPVVNKMHYNSCTFPGEVGSSAFLSLFLHGKWEASLRFRKNNCYKQMFNKHLDKPGLIFVCSLFPSRAFRTLLF